MREGVIDSTGLESDHASRYFRWIRRRKSEKHQRLGLKSWPKLTVLCHRKTQLVIGAFVCVAPTHEYPLFRTVLRKAERLMHFDRILADAGYDSEENHEFGRDCLKIKETVIPVRPRLRKRHIRACTGKYRRQMRYRFPRRLYRQRWQVESLFSRLKRRLGSHIFAHNWPAQMREAYLRVLTLNFLILKQLSGAI